MALWDVDAAFARWAKAAEPAEDVARRLAAPFIAEINEERARVFAAEAKAEQWKQSAVSADRRFISERARELETEKALFNKVFGSPANFQRLKEDLERREAAVRWAEQRCQQPVVDWMA